MQFVSLFGGILLIFEIDGEKDEFAVFYIYRDCILAFFFWLILHNGKQNIHAKRNRNLPIRCAK